MKSMLWLGAALAVALSTQAWSAGQLADLSVYDRTEGRRLPVHWHGGRAYVVGKPGNEYQVAVRNRSGADVLAVVSVDGVNVITGETASPQQSGYVLSPWRSLEIGGWRKSLSQTAAFYFTPLPDSYAARTGRPYDAGVIGVALFRKQVTAPPAPVGRIAPQARGERSGAGTADAATTPAKPAEAPVASARRYEESERLGTGHGRRETSHASYVDFTRATREPAETIAIYYDSYRNLVARGVVREPVAVPPAPRPFPAFVPDPQARFAPPAGRRGGYTRDGWRRRTNS